MKEKREKYDSIKMPETRPFSPSNVSSQSLSSNVSSPSSHRSRSPINAMSIQEIRENLMQYQTHQYTAPQDATVAECPIHVRSSTEAIATDSIPEHPVQVVTTGTHIYADEDEKLMELYGVDQWQVERQYSELTAIKHPENYTLASENSTESATNQVDYFSTLLFDNIHDPVELPIDVSTYWSLCPHDDLSLNHHEISK